MIMCTTTLNSNPNLTDVILLYESSHNFLQFFSQVHYLYQTNQNSLIDLFGVDTYSHLRSILDAFLNEKNSEDETERKRQGRFYTSKSVCRFINSRVLKHYDLTNSIIPNILDPSSGMGYFLFDMIFLLLPEISKRNEPISADHFLSHFHGYEIHKQTVELCKNLLLAVIGLLMISGTLTGDLKKIQRVIDQNVTEQNFLSAEIEFRPNIVIGNPPYIRIHKLSSENRLFLRKSYFTAIYDFDIYVCFFEKSLTVLSKDGILSFITPEKYLLRKYARNLRLLLLCNTNIIEMIDVSRCADIFKADTYPLITILRKITSELQYEEKPLIDYVKGNKIAFIRTNLFSREIQQQIHGILDGDFTQNNMDITFREFAFTIYQKFLEDPEYRFTFHLDPIMGQFEQLFEGLSKIGNINSTIFCGTPRSKYYHDVKLNLTEFSTPNSLKFIISRNISPYHIWWELPITFDHNRYVKSYYDTENGVFSKNMIDRFSKVPKILLKANSRNITAAVDNVGYSFVGVYGIIWNYPKIFSIRICCAIINSSLINYYLLRKYKSYMLNSQFLSINSTIIKDIPLPGNFDEQGNFYPRVSEDRFNEIIDKISKLLLELDNHIKKMKNRYSIEVLKKKLIQIQMVHQKSPDSEDLKTLEIQMNQINHQIMDLYAIPESLRLRIEEYYGAK